MTYEGIKILYEIASNTTKNTTGSGCINIRTQSLLSVILGIFLVAASLFSYVPQWVAIIYAKSSKGLSIFSITLANYGSWLSVWNAIILQWDIIDCCDNDPEWGWGFCQQHLLSIYQISVPAIGQFIIFHLFLIFYDYTDHETGGVLSSKKEFFLSLVAYGSNLLFFMMAPIAVSSLLLYYYGYHAGTTKTWAFILGIIAAVVTVPQWAPQIYKTWKMKSRGSLSVIMLAIQFPGSLLVTYFQAFSFGTSVSTWLPYFFSAIQQGMLLILCLWFMVRSWRIKRKEEKRKIESQNLLNDNKEELTNPGSDNEGVANTNVRINYKKLEENSSDTETQQ